MLELIILLDIGLTNSHVNLPMPENQIEFKFSYLRYEKHVMGAFYAVAYGGAKLKIKLKMINLYGHLTNYDRLVT